MDKVKLLINPQINPKYLQGPNEYVISSIIDSIITWAGPSQFDQMRALASIDMDSVMINADGMFEVDLHNVTGFGLKSNLSLFEIHMALCKKCISLTPHGTTVPPTSHVFLEDTATGISTLPKTRRP